MTIYISKKNIPFIIIILLSILYVTIRAFSVDITYDEASTLSEFVAKSVPNIISFIPCNANNHITNTLLIKLFTSLFGNNIIIVRLPNVLAFLIYLYFGKKITTEYLSYFVSIICFLVLIINPFLLDFFSLARGYGLAIGFLMPSIYYLLNFFENQKPLKGFFCLIFAYLSTASNFALLNYWLVACFLIFLLTFLSNIQIHKKKNILNIIFNILLLLVTVYEPIKKLKENGNLWYGGNTSFYEDTLVSLTKYTMYLPFSNRYVYLALNYIIILFIISVLLSFYFNKKILTPKLILLSILLISALSVYLQYHILGTLYLIDRSALFFYPIIILCMFFSLNEYWQNPISKIILIVLLSTFSYNFFACANFYKTALWYFDSHTQYILTEINQIGKSKNERMKIDFSWPFQSAIYYYTKNNQYPFIEIVKSQTDNEDCNPLSVYYIYLSYSLEKVGYDANTQKIIQYKKDTLDKFSNEHIVIFKNINKEFNSLRYIEN